MSSTNVRQVHINFFLTTDAALVMTDRTEFARGFMFNVVNEVFVDC